MYTYTLFVPKEFPVAQEKKAIELRILSSIKPKSTPASMLKEEIQSIYCDAQQLLLEKAKEALPKTDLAWHELFTEDQKRKIASTDGANLKFEVINKMYINTVKNWINYLYKVDFHKNETLGGYSIRVANESHVYEEKFNTFKEMTTQSQLLSIQKSEYASDVGTSALKKIKNMIESTNWDIGERENKTHIKIDGRNIAIPDYAYKIYQLCLAMEIPPEMNINDAITLLDEIHAISPDKEKLLNIGSMSL